MPPRTLVSILLLLCVAAPAAAQERDVSGLASLSAEQLATHLEFLSSDLLEGRAPGTRGGRLAAEYIAAQFARAGLAPFRGRFLHDVPLTGWRADTAATRLRVGAGTGAWRGRMPGSVVLWSPAARPTTVVSGPLVFAGYGITAPEYGWDDYRGDVRGRVVLVLAGDPPAPPDRPALFDGPALTWYGRWTYKAEEARRRGAAAVLLVHDPAVTGYGWGVVQTSWGGEVLGLAEDSARAPAVVGWIQADAARRLLARQGQSLDSLALRAGRAGFSPVQIARSTHLQVSGRARRLVSPNVVAVLPGSHATAHREHVVFTAHYDGLGIGAARSGDSIYNGAYDNASGVALLIELAEAFATLRPRPDRSLLLLASTGEEAGMLGATHFVRHTLAPAQITAAVNFDGANLWGETQDIGGVGAERSTLGITLARAAAQHGMRAVAERAPAQGYFFRSDHFPFARAGIPALGLEHGLEFRGRTLQWGADVVGGWLARNYHAPGDAFDPAFDLRGAVQQARVAFTLGALLGSASARPAWYDDARLPDAARLRELTEPGTAPATRR